LLPDRLVNHFVFHGIAARQVQLGRGDQAVDGAQVAGVAIDAPLLRRAAGGEGEAEGQEQHGFHGNLLSSCLARRFVRFQTFPACWNGDAEPVTAGKKRWEVCMIEEFETRKARASAWFRSLRDEIVASFEGLEDSHADGGTAGRFEVTETRRESGGGGL